MVGKKSEVHSIEIELKQLLLLGPAPKGSADDFAHRSKLGETTDTLPRSFGWMRDIDADAGNQDLGANLSVFARCYPIALYQLNKMFDSIRVALRVCTQSKSLINHAIH